jgi:hypothetical protein
MLLEDPVNHSSRKRKIRLRSSHRKFLPNNKITLLILVRHKSSRRNKIHLLPSKPLNSNSKILLISVPLNNHRLIKEVSPTFSNRFLHKIILSRLHRKGASPILTNKLQPVKGRRNSSNSNKLHRKGALPTSISKLHPFKRRLNSNDN